jgi:hypothetical protein
MDRRVKPGDDSGVGGEDSGVGASPRPINN